MADAPVARLDGAAIQIKNLLFVFAGYSTIDYTSCNGEVDHWSLAVKDGKALEKEWRTEIPIARGGPHRTTSGPVSSGGMPGPASLKKSNSGPLNKHGEPLKKSSGPQSGGVTPTGRQNSGPLPPVLPATGLITSGPISSGPLNASGAPLKVVTCGNLPLELSFQKVPRCMYTSTSLYEYRGWDSKAANPTHHRFTWGLRSIERRVVDFYISDFQSGLRALVKTGSGARVTPYVDDSIVIDVNPENEELSPEFIGREEPFK
ncbi:PREDICTED: membrane [Prunus dulcis]|uniref:PREDICTED: membrane n=1 Tax=Prunus dulcis TaxID=3755 RepID=A0A5E4EFV8_PRUDU|nr:PREDICTED: membrane [Prunus dulcis]